MMAQLGLSPDDSGPQNPESKTIDFAPRPADALRTKHESNWSHYRDWSCNHSRKSIEPVGPGPSRTKVHIQPELQNQNQPLIHQLRSVLRCI